MVSEDEQDIAVEEKHQQQSQVTRSGGRETRSASLSGVAKQAASAVRRSASREDREIYSKPSSSSFVEKNVDTLSPRPRASHGFTSSGHDSPPLQNRIENRLLPPSPLVTPPMASYPHGVPPPSPPGSGPASPNTQASSPGSNKSGSNKRLVPHVYHDYSQVPDVPGYVRKKTGGVTQPFPDKLHEMLAAEAGDHADVVAWLPHGRAFIVRKPKEFTADIMPKYFRQSKLTSFQRQLNLYGFRRITQGVDSGAYYHELFLRGRPALSLRMVRQKVKGTGHKQPADTSTEPNFYKMPPMSPLGGSPTMLGSGVPGRTNTLLSSDAGSPESGATPSPGGYYYQAGSSPPSGGDRSQPRHQQMPMSPGLQGVHGAAHLLRGISSGVPVSQLPPTPFLGQAAASHRARGDGSSPTTRSMSNTAAATATQEGTTSLKPQPASFLRPRDSGWKEEQV